MSHEAQMLLMYAKNLDSLERVTQQTPALDLLYYQCLDRARFWAGYIIGGTYITSAAGEY